MKIHPSALVVLMLISTTLTGFAAVPDSPSKVVMAVNDPREMSFTDLEALIAYTSDRLVAQKTLEDRDILEFYQALRNHGAPNASPGGASTKVALVVPAGVANEGILVVKGDFDRETVFEIISRRYEEHVNQHIADDRQKELGIGAPFKAVLGYPTRRFAMPLRSRELHIVDVGDCTVFASHQQGDLALLEKTVQVVSGKIEARAPQVSASQISYVFQPVGDETNRILGAVDSSFDRYMQGATKYKRGISRFTDSIKRIVAQSKVNRVKDAVSNMLRTTFTVKRGSNAFADSSFNGKLLTCQIEFADAQQAQEVKASGIKHLVAAMKQPQNQGLALAMQNPQITAQGNSVFLQVPLESEEDQMHAFSVASTLVARNILGTRSKPVVRRLKLIADEQACLARNLNDRLSNELARTSLFSFRKYGLMYQKMRVSSDVRSCEKTYVGLTDKPEVMEEAVGDLAEVTARDLKIIDDLIESRKKDLSRCTIPPRLSAEFAVLQAVRQSVAANARHLVLTARSSAFRNAGAKLSKSLDKKLTELEKMTPRMLGAQDTAGQKAGQAAGQTAGSQVQVAGGQPTQADAAAGGAARTQAVAIPAGMTLEQAQREYQEALTVYTAAVNTNDMVKTRQAYDRYMAKYAVYQALLEKTEQDREQDILR